LEVIEVRSGDQAEIEGATPTRLTIRAKVPLLAARAGTDSAEMDEVLILPS